jgi:membrane protease YdiL (CAAX protease family)
MNMRRIGTVLKSAVVAFAITGVGMSVWGAVLLTNLATTPAIPWAALVMSAALWAMWQYLGGRWAPVRTSAIRDTYRRARPVARPLVLWSIAANTLAIVALAGLWIVLFQLVPMPPNLLPDMSRYPPLTIVAVLLMSSLVAPFIEEAAFRGYAQVPLERAFGGLRAVLISSALFALVHVTHGLLWPKLLVYFLVGVAFGTTAFLTRSLVPGIISHIIGDVTFFTLVWPYDATRRLVWQSADPTWFWIHVVQVMVFAPLAVIAFVRLAALVSQHDRVPRRGSPAGAARSVGVVACL